jgi:hypothetical protein
MSGNVTVFGDIADKFDALVAYDEELLDNWVEEGGYSLGSMVAASTLPPRPAPPPVPEALEAPPPAAGMSTTRIAIIAGGAAFAGAMLAFLAIWLIMRPSGVMVAPAMSLDQEGTASVRDFVGGQLERSKAARPGIECDALSNAAELYGLNHNKYADSVRPRRIRHRAAAVCPLLGRGRRPPRT